MKRLQFQTSDGFSLIEMLITLVVGSVVSMFAFNLIKGSMESNKLAKRLNVVNELESKVAMAFANERSFLKTKASNKALDACLDSGGGDDCKMVDAPIDLWLISGDESNPVERKLTGSYDAELKPCQTGCPLELVTKFTADCNTKKASCDVASSINVLYEIKLNGQPLKGGMLSRKIASNDVSDENHSCPVSATDGTATFLNSVQGGPVKPELTCAAPPRPSRTLHNVNAGECKRGIEVLAGFDASGNIICIPVQFTAH